MFELSAIVFFTYMLIGSCAFTNEVINSQINDMKNSEVEWHSHDMAEGAYPYIVSLAFIEELVVTRHCTGSLIHSTWVLSSAHCYHDFLDRKFYVWYGNYTVSPLLSRLFSTVLKIYIHPAFHNSKFSERGFFFGDNDISLLKCGKVIVPVYGRLSTIDHSKMYGLTVKYIGGAARYLSMPGVPSKYVFGAKKNNDGLKKKKGGLGMNIGRHTPSKRKGEQFRPLQVGEAVVINCGMELTMWSKYVLCIAPTCSDKLHQPLHGDFGGPFIYDGKIVGVMSISFKIPNTFLMSNGLTPISPYMDWINHVTRPMNKENLTLQEKLDICEKKVEKCVTNKY